jgi:Protein of unknown function (DUF3551)
MVALVFFLLRLCDGGPRRPAMYLETVGSDRGGGEGRATGTRDAMISSPIARCAPATGCALIGAYRGLFTPALAGPRRIVMRANLISVSLMMMTLLVTDADAASNRWCVSIPKRGENCAYATLDQCRAYVLGLGGWCRPNPLPGTAFGTSGTWSSGPPRQYRGGY